MEKNKRLISILTVCLLSVLAVLPLFSVTVFASGSITDSKYYDPLTTVTVSVTGIGSSHYEGEYLHFPLTYYSGDHYTLNYNVVDSPDGDSLFSAVQTIDSNGAFFEDGYSNIPQYFQLLFDQNDQTIVNQITFTIKNLYIFEDYFDDFPQTVNASFIGSISSTGNPTFYSSLADGSLYCRYRAVGDELYTSVSSSSHTFSPFMDPIDDVDGDLDLGGTEFGTDYFKFDEYTKLPFFEKGVLYHVDELSLTYYVSGFANMDSLLCNFQYYNVYNIDNIVVTEDKSNIHLPLRDFTGWLGTATSGFFTAEIAPGFSLGGIVMMCLAFALVIWFLKIFAGG